MDHMDIYIYMDRYPYIYLSIYILGNNKGMPKKKANNGQNYEKRAFSELKIPFKATNRERGIKTKTCQTGCFSRTLALEPGSPGASPAGQRL